MANTVRRAAAACDAGPGGHVRFTLRLRTTASVWVSVCLSATGRIPSQCNATGRGGRMKALCRSVWQPLQGSAMTFALSSSTGSLASGGVDCGGDEVPVGLQSVGQSDDSKVPKLPQRCCLVALMRRT